MRKVDVAVVAGLVAATAAATVVLPDLDDATPDVEAPSGEVVEIHENVPDRRHLDRVGPVVMDFDEPLVCMVDLDCLLHEVEVASGIVPAAPAAGPAAGVVVEAAPPPDPAVSYAPGEPSARARA